MKKRPGLIIIFMLFVILALSLVQVSLSNRIATDGAKLAKIDQQIDGYKKQNAILGEQALGAASFTIIANKAQKLGFVPEKSPIYLSTPLPLALKQ